MSLLNAALLILVSLCASPVWAFNLSAEIAELNRDYGKALGYPIVVFDKHKFKTFAESVRFDGTDEETFATLMQAYLKKEHLLTVELSEAQSLIPYLTNLNTHASAIPYFSYGHPLTMKFCVVMPSGLAGSVFEETTRSLGAQGAEHLYGYENLQRLSRMFTAEQFRLVSLYHEISHCMDRTYLPRAYQGEPDPHSVHMAESFAEANALILLAQRKQVRGWGKGRALLRGIYSKVLGPYLAKQGASGDNVLKEYGGSIYFLNRSIEATEKKLAQDYLPKNLEETLVLSTQITEQSALPSRSFRALHFSFQQGEEKTLADYHKLATEHPDLFRQAYDDLVSVLDTLRSLVSP